MLFSPVSAQNNSSRSIEALYMSAPLHVCPMLTPQQRFELLEKAKVGQFDTITNFLYGKSWVEMADFDNQHIIVRQTKGSTIEMYCKDSQSVVIQTVYAPLASSQVYIVKDRNWHVKEPVSIQFEDCKDQPATYIKATIQNDSLLLENKTLDQIYNTDETPYRNCPRFKTMPIPF